jgi:hypothetical protein
VPLPRSPRRLVAAAVTLALALLAVPAAAVAATGPTLLSPGANAVIARATRPTFVVRDRSLEARRYKVWITISSTKRVRRGELQIDRSSTGVFSSMRRRRGGRYTFKPTLYSFPTYFLQRPGRYWWQAHHIDCAVRSAPRCHIVSRLRSFTVR